MKLLRLATTLNPTSAPYNQFSLGLKTAIDQTYCSLLKNDIPIDNCIKGFHGDGSIFKMIKVVRKLVTQNNYDVVHIHSGITGIIFLIAILPFRIFLLKKTVFTLHNSWNIIKARNQILNIIVMLASMKICTCGKSSKDSIPKKINFFIEKKTLAVVNGFDHHRIDSVESAISTAKHFNQSSKVRILCVGALNNTKNQIALLEALKTAKIEAEIIFLGDGTNKDSLIDFSKELDRYTKTIFKGRVSRNLTIEHMLEADVSISLSKGEGLPIAVLESMYAGCFQILSTIPPHKEISPPMNRCIYVDASNLLEIISSLDFIRDNIPLIRSNRAASREYSVKNFGLDNMLKEYMTVYNSLLNIGN